MLCGGLQIPTIFTTLATISKEHFFNYLHPNCLFIYTFIPRFANVQFSIFTRIAFSDTN